MHDSMNRAERTRWGLGLGVSLWAAEVFAAIQARPTFRPDGWVFALLTVYLLLGAVARWAGPLRLHRLMVVLTGLATAIFCYGELVLSTHGPRLAAAVGGVLGVVLLDWLLRNRVGLLRRTGLMAVGWVLAATQIGTPRQVVLALMDRRWIDLGGHVLRSGLVLAVVLLGLWVAGQFRRQTRRGTVLGGILLSAGGIAFTGWGTRAAPADTSPRGDVIYLVLDSLRGDMLPYMPALQDWAKTGITLADAHSPSISTTHSLPRMLGLPEPDRLALRGRWRPTRNGWDQGLPAQARARGLRTHLISDYASNSLAGLEVYQWNTVSAQPQRALLLPNLSRALWAIMLGGDDRLRKVRGAKQPFSTGTALGDLDALLRDDERPGFYLVHLAVPHAPYNQPPYRVETAEALALEDTRALNEKLRLGPSKGQLDPKPRQQLYRQAVIAADAQVKRLRAILVERRAARPPLVMITADHGESLGDRGAAGHGRSLFAEGHHVPWIIIGPGVATDRTLTEPVSNAQSKTSVLRWLDGGNPTPKAQDVLRVWHPRGQMVQTGGWRLIATTDTRQLKRPHAWAHRTAFQLFDVQADPAERVDRSDDAQPRLQQLKALLQ